MKFFLFLLTTIVLIAAVLNGYFINDRVFMLISALGSMPIMFMFGVIHAEDN